MKAAFDCWGPPIHSVKTILEKRVAFVSFASRTAAEFAKEAMHGRPLLPGPKGLLDPECNIRWYGRRAIILRHTRSRAEELCGTEEGAGEFNWH